MVYLHSNYRGCTKKLTLTLELKITDEMTENISDSEVSLIPPDCQILLHRIDVQSVPTYLQHRTMALTCAIYNSQYTITLTG